MSIKINLTDNTIESTDASIQLVGSTAIQPTIVQQVFVQDGAVATGANNYVDDDSIPQQTGDTNIFLSLAITPRDPDNILLIEAIGNFTAAGANSRLLVGLWRDTTEDAVAVCWDGPEADNLVCTKIRARIPAGSTSPTTFKLGASSNASTTTFNGFGGAARFGGTLASTITITEISACPITTWDPLNKGTNITLTGGNLVAENTVGNLWTTVLSTLSHTTGKYYWEYNITTNTGQTTMVGAQATIDLTTFVGGSASSFGWQANPVASSSARWRNNANIGDQGSYTAGDVVAVAFDIDSGDVWFSVNGTYISGDPSLETSPSITGLSAGTWLAGYSPFTLGHNATVNLGATPFAFAIPTDYNSWDDCQ